MECDLTIVTYPLGLSGRYAHYSVRCLTHNCSTPMKWSNKGIAFSQFRCDKGEPKRFFVEVVTHDGPNPKIMDLSQLNNTILSAAEATDYGDIFTLNIWLWNGGVNFTQVFASSTVSQWDDNDYATHSVVVTDLESGAVYLETSRRIDGRA